VSVNETFKKGIITVIICLAPVIDC